MSVCRLDSSIREFFTNCVSLSVVELAKLPLTGMLTVAICAC